MRCILLKLLLPACLVGSQGCSPVAPWERGNLAKPDMALDPNPNLSHIRDHIYTSREASQGGRTSSGGGCGCN
jgi:hypothetical protein